MDLLRAGAPAGAALDAKRAEIEALAEELDSVIRADAADVDLMEQCRAAVAGEIERGYVAGFDALRRSNAFVALMDFSIRGVPTSRDPYQNNKVPDLNAGTLYAQINALGRKLKMGDDLAVQVVFETTKARQGSAPGLPTAERQAKIRELGEELRRLQRAEEIEVLKLEAAGFHVLRRADIDPAIIFDVWSTYQEPARIAA